jgi:hypothetical protein
MACLGYLETPYAHLRTNWTYLSIVNQVHQFFRKDVPWIPVHFVRHARPTFLWKAYLNHHTHVHVPFHSTCITGWRVQDSRILFHMKHIFKSTYRRDSFFPRTNWKLLLPYGKKAQGWIWSWSCSQIALIFSIQVKCPDWETCSQGGWSQTRIYLGPMSLLTSSQGGMTMVCIYAILSSFHLMFCFFAVLCRHIYLSGHVCDLSN